MPDHIGQVMSLWRYPVKSMMGEELNAADVTERGVLGDRCYALVDKATGKLASAKHPRKWQRLFEFHAAFVEPPRLGAPPPPVRITFPDGRIVGSDERRLDELLSLSFGRDVTFEAGAPDRSVFEEVWPEVKGDRIYGIPQPRGGDEVVTDVPAAFSSPAGTFFDFSAIHLITTNTLDRLRELAPQSRFEVRRFRPNLVVTVPDSPGFVENAWSRKIVAIGESVRLKIIIPTPRCVMTTLAQSDLPDDPGILRAMADHNRIRAGGLGELPCAGIYAAVITRGSIRRGDPVHVE